MELSELVVSAAQPADEDGTIMETNNNFWSQIMAECQANCPNKLPSSKSLLVLGEDDSQKTQLIAKLQGSGEKLRKGNGLQYHFLTVRDEYCENQTKLDVWVLDEDPEFKNLLKYVLNDRTLPDTTVLLTASMAKPWDIHRCMCSWTEIVEEHIRSCGVPEDVMEERKAKVLKRYQEYVEPTASIYGTLDDQSNTDQIENNLGVEIIVVITQTEHMTTLQSEYGFIEEHFDFIQFSLRKFCMTYGAALLYVSVKEDRNCDILLKYVLHKIYSLPFRIPAMFLEKDSIFVPAGWDSQNKILTLAESLATIAFSSPYEEVVAKPGRLADRKKFAPEVEAQRDQDFLLGIQPSVMRPLPENNPSGGSTADSVSASVSSRNPPRRVQRSPKKKQLENKLASGEGDTVLQSFFKSLLKRQTSAPGERPPVARGYIPNDDSQTNSSKGSLGSRRQGASVDSPTSLSAVDELNPADDFNSKLQRELRKMDASDQASSDPFSDFISKYRSQEEKPPHNPDDPLDEDDVKPLPEYFMSSQGGSHCSNDCCAPTSNGGNFGDLALEDTLDRVKSKYNPPLRLLLESSSHDENKSLQNGIKQSVNCHAEKDEKLSESSKPEAGAAGDSSQNQAEKTGDQ